jgi:hypothetical protein
MPGFLETILRNIASRENVNIDGLMTDGMLTRLVVASGGVPRDYLRLAGEAIKHARNRGISAKRGSEKVMAEDVNSAAGQTAEAKLDDLREDAPLEAAALQKPLEDLAEFCRHIKAAYFMVDGRDAGLSGKIKQLQDLRFVHLLFDGETVPDLGSRRHKVLLLDVAYLQRPAGAAGGLRRLDRQVQAPTPPTRLLRGCGRRIRLGGHSERREAGLVPDPAGP